MTKQLRLHRFGILVALAACGGSSSSQPDAATASAATQACNSVGTSLCHQFYACYSASDIAGLGLPATEVECVTQENSGCTSDPAKPGYCKGSAQTSTAMAMACSAELAGLTCAQFKQPTSSGVCKTELCAP